MALETELQKIYESEINVQISWMWDAGFRLGLGDCVNGFIAEVTVNTVEEILLWLQQGIAEYFPDSTYQTERKG
jgi:hypothetical protein